MRLGQRQRDPGGAGQELDRRDVAAAQVDLLVFGTAAEAQVPADGAVQRDADGRRAGLAGARPDPARLADPKVALTDLVR